ncbi:MAG: sulfide/dihydroorotate dehydrogenase-like FAD/NAD-binding protein [bacterium]
MAKIVFKQRIAPNNVLMRLSAPRIAQKVLPGQFIILRIDEKGERIPLTVADKNYDKGEITIIFQEVGKTTKRLGTLSAGGMILDLVGPLGGPTEIEELGTVITVGGGVGVAEVYPVTKAFREKGNKVISIIGARSKELVILEKELKSAADELFVATDDGSYGTKGFVTDILKEVLEKGIKLDLVYAIGPIPMMKAVGDVTRPYGIKTVVSLNAVMLDGTGMCGTCRVTVGGKVKFACVDGPEFDAHNVDWKELMVRSSAYKYEEQESLKRYEHECKLEKQL